MAVSDLTTIDAVRGWCGITPSTNTADPLLTRLISSASQVILGFLGRPPLYSQTITDIYDGNGSQRLMLKRWPVTSVSAVAVDNVAILSANAPGPGASCQIGFFAQPWDGTPPGLQQYVDLYGANSFFMGRQNVVITYTSGYLIANEAQTTPTGGGTLSVSAPYGPWCADGGVTMNGVAMTLKSPGTTLASGQYSLTADVPGQYNFAAADEGNAIQISYSFVPFDLHHACTELVGERYRAKGRIGEVSHGGGGETTSFTQKDLSDAVKTMLQPYRKVTIF